MLVLVHFHKTAHVLADLRTLHIISFESDSIVIFIGRKSRDSKSVGCVNKSLFCFLFLCVFAVAVPATTDTSCSNIRHIHFAVFCWY